MTKGEFLSRLLGTLDAVLLGSVLPRKREKAKIPGWVLVRACEETIRAGQDF